MNKNPLVSIVVANYNCEAYIAQSLSSALNQSLKDIEIIVVDDNSTDNSREITHEMASKDSRLKIINLEVNMGPSGARNKALEIAQGDWIAIMDSDDLMHPDRLTKLLLTAKEHNADIVVDDLIIFSENEASTAYNYLQCEHGSPYWVSLPEYVSSNSFNTRNRSGYGILRPLIRTKLIQASQTVYDESLTNSEDYDFIVRLMLAGATYLITPYAGYYYRKHSASISYRLDIDMLENMYTADQKIRSLISSDNAELIIAVENRHQSIKNMLSFQKSIEALKQRQYFNAFFIIIVNPNSAPLFLIPIGDILKRLQSKVKRIKTPAHQSSDAEKVASFITKGQQGVDAVFRKERLH